MMYGFEEDALPDAPRQSERVLCECKIDYSTFNSNSGHKMFFDSEYPDYTKSEPKWITCIMDTMEGRDNRYSIKVNTGNDRFTQTITFSKNSILEIRDMVSNLIDEL